MMTFCLIPHSVIECSLLCRRAKNNINGFSTTTADETHLVNPAITFREMADGGGDMTTSAKADGSTFQAAYALSATSLSTSLTAGLEGLLGSAGNGGGTLGLRKGQQVRWR